MAADFSVPFLGRLPLDPRIGQFGSGLATHCSEEILDWILFLFVGKLGIIQLLLPSCLLAVGQEVVLDLQFLVKHMIVTYVSIFYLCSL